MGRDYKRKTVADGTFQYLNQDPKPRREASCEGCGQQFGARYDGHRYCTTKCQAKSYNRTFLASGGFAITSLEANNRGSRGAISELLAAADLMAKGYEVFRNLSPTGPCDLLIFKDSHPLKIEVRSGTINRMTGTRGWNTVDAKRADIAAIVFTDGIHYLDAATSKVVEL